MADGAVAEVAARQGGVVARRQLLARGASRHAIAGRVASGLLTPLWPGVYAVGCPPPARHGWMWAAVLAGGPGGWLSHDSAAWRLEWMGACSRWHGGRIGHSTRLAGLEIHGCEFVPAGEVIDADGMPCSSPARTLVDLAACRPRRQIEQCLDQWEKQGTYNGLAIEAALRRGRPGSAALRAIVRSHEPGTTVARNRFEELFLRFLRARRIGGFRFNEPMQLPSGTPIVVDVWWPRERVAVELDGRATHARAAAFESDRARDLELQEMEIPPGRITSRKLTREPGWVEERLRRLLAARSPADRAG